MKAVSYLGLLGVATRDSCLKKNLKIRQCDISSNLLATEHLASASENKTKNTVLTIIMQVNIRKYGGKAPLILDFYTRYK